MDSEIVAAIIMAVASVIPSVIAAIKGNGAGPSEPNAELAKWLSERSEQDATSLARMYAAAWKWKYKEEPSHKITQVIILALYVPMIAIIAYCLVLSVNSAVQKDVPIFEVLSTTGAICMLAIVVFVAVLGILLVVHDNLRKKDIDGYLEDTGEKSKVKYMRSASRVLRAFCLGGATLIFIATVLYCVAPDVNMVFSTVLAVAGTLITVVAEMKWVSLFCRADDVESDASEERHSGER